MTLAAGDKAPAFDVARDGGGRVSLADFSGRKLVLYFYPKDDTMSCTAEAVAFNLHRAKFRAAGTALLGVSPDSVESHDKFRKKYGLSIPLASDEQREMAEAYGVWAEKSMWGLTFMGVVRSTFLIDAAGVIARVWTKVKVKGHAEEVLAAARALIPARVI